MFKTLLIASALTLGLSSGAIAAHHGGHSEGHGHHGRHTGDVIPPDQFGTGSIYVPHDEGAFSSAPASPYLLGPCGFNILGDQGVNGHYCGK